MVSNGIRRHGIFGLLCALLAVTLNADTPRSAQIPTGAVPHRHRPIRIHERRDGSVTAHNWSGYAVTGAPGSVTAARGSWVVPTIHGTCPSTNQYASFWVGIDGFSSTTVEQIGTDSDCQNGNKTYYAWFEFYPHPAHLIKNVTISPGDIISAEVQYVGGNRFTVRLTDVTTGQSFSTTVTVPHAQRSSAEWIAEAPSSAGGILPLTDFGTASFGFDSTDVSGTCDATVGGTTAAIKSFGNAVQTITMVTSSGAVKAQPSGLSSDGTSFVDQWVSAGP